MREVKCKECGDLRVVNKHFMLCHKHNELRLNNGKTKQQVYVERAQERNKEIEVGELKKKYSIKKISGSNRYRCSDGSFLTSQEINKKYRETQEYITKTRPAICQGTGKNEQQVPLSFSHTISRARCKALGKCELIFDSDNIEIEGFEAPTSTPTEAHNIWADGNLEQKRSLFNFNRKLEYIKKHDQESYKKLTWDNS